LHVSVHLTLLVTIVTIYTFAGDGHVKLADFGLSKILDRDLVQSEGDGTGTPTSDRFQSDRFKSDRKISPKSGNVPLVNTRQTVNVTDISQKSTGSAIFNGKKRNGLKGECNDPIGITIGTSSDRNKNRSVRSGLSQLLTPKKGAKSLPKVPPLSVYVFIQSLSFLFVCGKTLSF
jgi:hypothetical protein